MTELASSIPMSDDVKYRGLRYVSIEGGLAWLDPRGADTAAMHWLVIVGRMEDGTYRVLEETKGNLAAIGNAAVSAKDRLLMKRIWVDASQQGGIDYLRNVGGRGIDGLTRYASNGKDRAQRVQYVHQPEYWPHFRTRDTIASLIPIPDEIQADVQGGIDLIAGLMSANRLEIVLSATGIQWIVKQDLETMHRHPSMKALIWPISMMERRASAESKTAAFGGWYGNLR